MKLNNKEAYLVYVHNAGISYDDVISYQFLFADTTKDIDGIGWDEYPAMGHPNPPNKNKISIVGEVKTTLDIILIQNNEQFSMWDAVDGLIALAWEDIEGYDDYPDDRLVFHYGMKYDDVAKMLYSRDIPMNSVVKIEH